MDAEILFISAFCSRSPHLTSAGKQRDQRALKPGAGQNIALLPRPAASQQICHSCLPASRFIVLNNMRFKHSVTNTDLQFLSSASRFISLDITLYG